MSSALDVLAAAIGSQQVDDCHVVVSALGGAVDSLVRRDAEFRAEVGPREDATPAPAPQQQPAQPQEQAPRVLFGIFSVSPFLAMQWHVCLDCM